MLSARTAAVALTFAAARLSAAAPLEIPVPPPDGILPVENTPCDVDGDCPVIQWCRPAKVEGSESDKTCQLRPNVNTRSDEAGEPQQEGSPCSGSEGCPGELRCVPSGPGLAVLTCQAEMSTLPVETRAQPEEDGACTPGDEGSCPEHQACLQFGKTKMFKCQDKPEEGSPCSTNEDCDGELKCLPDSSGEFNTEVLTCQGTMTILPVENRSQSEEGSPCSTSEDCGGELKCRPDASGEFNTEVLTCQGTMNILPIESRSQPEDIQPEEGSACTGEEDEGSCPSHQICLPWGNTKMFKCQDKPEGYCETDEDCDGERVCLKTMILPEPKSGRCV